MENKQTEHLPDVRNKMTAVEWLEKQFEEQTMISVYAFEDQLYFRKLLNQAKQMEKEQMMEFSNNVLDNTIGDLILLYSVEKIYNETYGKDNG